MIMKNSRTTSGLAASLVLLIAAAPAGSADKYKAPRTSWGDPVIQGVFTNNTDVPFERGRDAGDKAFFTEQEYRARKKAQAEAPEGETTPGTAADVHYSNEEFGLTVDQADMVKSLRTSIITLPANGRLPPLTAEAQKRSNAARSAEAGRTYNSAQDRPLGERCIIWPHEGPPLRPVAYNTHVQIMQTKDHVVFMSEMIHDARMIPIARSKPDFGGLRRWQGNSWGHWEGDTLVIETTGILDRFMPRGSNVPMGPDAVIIEKLTRTGPKTVMYEFKVTDPSLWDVSWGGEYPLEFADGPVFEYACHEGNYGIANTLRGAREEEKAAGKR
jgi:hypothetical protein